MEDGLQFMANFECADYNDHGHIRLLNKVKHGITFG